MAKQGMKRPEPDHRKNELPPVPQINGKARHGKQKAAPLITEGSGKVFRNSSDLALENLMNDFDMTAADAQDFRRTP